MAEELELCESAERVIREAGARRRRGDLPAAAGLLEAALRGPVETAASRVRVYLELGKIYDSLDRRGAAQSCYRRVLALTDDWAFRSEARRLYRQAYRVRPATRT